MHPDTPDLAFYQNKVVELEKKQARLQAEYDHFKQLYEKAPLSYQSLDENGNFIEINQAWLDTLGYSREEVIGRNFSEFLAPEWRSHFRDNFPKLKAIGEILGVEFKMVRKDGSSIIVSLYGKIGKDNQGLFLQTHCIFQDITKQRQTEQALRSLEWMLSPKPSPLSTDVPRDSLEVGTYGDLTILNRGGIIAASIDKEILQGIVSEYLDLLETSSAIYEKNGDYALGLFSSSWCSMMDTASRRLCRTDDNAIALASGNWLCHESCWSHASQLAIETQGPVDIECHGGIRLYAIPIFARGEVIGAINFGYGDPPRDLAKLQNIGQLYNLGEEELQQAAQNYNSRPPFIIELAKTRLHKSAEMISILVERKLTEKALKLSESRHRTLIDTMPDLVWLKDADGTYLSCNKTFQRLYGVEESRLVGKKDCDFTSKEIADSFRMHDQKAMESKGSTVNEEYLTFAENGYHGLFETIKTAMHDEDGNLIGVLGVARDISERVKSENRIKESERKFRTLFEHAADAIYLAAMDGTLLDCNTSAQKQTGYSREELLALTVSDLDPRSAADKDRENIWDNIGLGEIATLSTRHLRKDGSHFPVEISLSKIEMEQEIVLLAFVRDVTEKVETEGLLRQALKMEAIGTLAGGIAHDFNNILAAILGYAEIAHESSPEGTLIREDLQQVLQAANRAKGLVQQILAFSRQTVSEKKLLQPALIVTETISLLRSSLPATIKIEQDVDMGASNILADPTEIHQVVMNLCTNAYHAMEETGGTLTVSLKNRIITRDDLENNSHLQPGNFIHLFVKDSGVGISQELVSRIFDPYFTTKDIGKGTGMGLAIVHGIVKGYDGTITCRSEPGEGTTFEILLPASPEQSKVKAQQAASVAVGSERILFIDDEKMLTQMASLMLGRLGYQVTTCNSSLEALEMFENQPEAFDLVITDQTMPEMTGVDLSRRILQLKPQQRIIICTGFSSLISESQAHAIGIKGFAHKPITKSDMAVLVRKVLDEND
jgi:PAS domain S-box-containing protein